MSADNAFCITFRITVSVEENCRFRSWAVGEVGVAWNFREFIRKLQLEKLKLTIFDTIEVSTHLKSLNFVF